MRLQRGVKKEVVVGEGARMRMTQNPKLNDESHEASVLREKKKTLSPLNLEESMISMKGLGVTTDSYTHTI